MPPRPGVGGEGGHCPCSSYLTLYLTLELTLELTPGTAPGGCPGADERPSPAQHQQPVFPGASRRSVGQPAEGIPRTEALLAPPRGARTLVRLPLLGTSALRPGKHGAISA